MKLIKTKHIITVLAILFLYLPLSCQENTAEEELTQKQISLEEEEWVEWIPLEVKASAYNSIEEQTKKGNVGVAAWGDTLTPGVKAIAISNDLLNMGLAHNTPVKIDGLDGIYYVKDRMHPRWKNKIDIYMGIDIRKARNWGVRKVTIYVRPEDLKKS
ncbi:MAG TPA: hypothetical protein VFM70_02405 [Salinimicrobium sp.]|nr:hypothetical protein [Salinimicrobium sp.]